MKDYYAILGVKREAGTREIKSAFRRKAKDLHPDLAPEPAGEKKPGDAMLLLLEAYRVLADPERRHSYDDEMKRRGRTPDTRSTFDYRAWLKERQDDIEYQAKLVFYDLLHDLDDEALETYEKLRSREDGRLERFFERAEAVDAEFCIAELYERNEAYGTAFAIYLRLMKMEREKPVFGYFFEVVLGYFKRLVLEKFAADIDEDEYLAVLDEAADAVPLDSLKAAFMKRKAELLWKRGDRFGAEHAISEAVRRNARTPGLATLRNRIFST
ncbi:MAG: DnaJ domain-containing protein [Spirochaetes bacterium]|nr:DnaJ domain-containing protein [Spirochaetota bacterium]